MKKAVFDDSGFPVAFYDDEIHESIPDGAVEITDDQWQEFIENPGERKFENGEVVIHEIVLTASEQALLDIGALEAQITPRRLREALLTSEGKTWLENKEAEISALRAQL